MNPNVLEHWFYLPRGLHLLFLLPILTVLSVFAGRQRRRALLRLGRLPALLALADRRRQWRGLRSLLLVMGMSTLAVGVAGPQWGREPVTATAPGRDLVVVLDLSRSMLVEDVLPCRLEKAQAALKELIENLKQRGGHRVALVAFAGRAKIVCPLTHDYDHFLERVGELGAAHLPPDLRPSGAEAVSGTRIGAGLLLAVEAHDVRFRGTGIQDILLLSDGDDPATDMEWAEGADAAREAGMPVYTVGIGDPNEGHPVPGGVQGFLTHQGKTVRSKLHEAPLEEIARRTKGTYTAARTGPIRLTELFRGTIEAGPKREAVDEAPPVYRQRYVWFFAAALLLLTLEMTIGGRNPSAKKPAAPPAAGRG
jgi:Ca-activated chloride channel family protein